MLTLVESGATNQTHLSHYLILQDFYLRLSRCTCEYFSGPTVGCILIKQSYCFFFLG